MRRLIGCESLAAIMINHARDAIYLDENGFDQPDQAFFRIEEHERPLAGKGLVLGISSLGDAAPIHIDAQRLRETIHFLDLDDVEQAYRDGKFDAFMFTENTAERSPHRPQVLADRDRDRKR